MSLQLTKSRLVSLFDEGDNQVIALSGKWGTGKTHLWREIQAESSEDTIKKARYASLFGLSSIDQVKGRLIESAAPYIESHSGVVASLKNVVKLGLKAGSSHYKALAALNDVSLSWIAPVFLTDSVIVLDDIERRKDELGVDEVLGFIDEYSNQHNSKFLLILNNDQLDRQDQWETFREKVIDQELKLTVTPDEAFRIAVNLCPSLYEKEIKRASVKCGLTNIRIIKKAINATNTILENRNLDDSVTARTIPSIVLLSAIHYRGLADGPDIEFVLRVGSDVDWLHQAIDEEKEQDEGNEHHKNWRLLLQELGIHSCDDFEVVLVEFLESGLVDSSKVEAIIDRYIEEQDNLVARELANEFQMKAFWDHRLNNNQLVAEAKSKFPKIAGKLDPYTVSEIAEILMPLPSGESVGNMIIQAWIDEFNPQDVVNLDDHNPFRRPINPKILEAVEKTNVSIQKMTSALDACMKVIDLGEWGTPEMIAIKATSAEDFENYIREMDIEKLRRFMRGMINMCQEEIYLNRFNPGLDRFVDACKKIGNDSSSPRLQALIVRLFESTKISIRSAEH